MLEAPEARTFPGLRGQTYKAAARAVALSRSRVSLSSSAALRTAVSY